MAMFGEEGRLFRSRRQDAAGLARGLPKRGTEPDPSGRWSAGAPARHRLKREHSMNNHALHSPFTAHPGELTTKLSQRGAFILAGLMALTSASAATYDVEHTLRLRPGGNIVPRVSATYYAHAWVEERGPACSASAVQPAAQPVGWGSAGWDRLDGRRGRVRNQGNGGGAVDANTGLIAVGAGGLNQTITANAAGCNSTAIANSQFAINPLVAGGMVTGTIRAFGEATAVIRPPRRSAAYAFSMAMVEAQGGRQLRNGTIQWRKVVRDLAAGQASSRRQIDPIEYTVRDLVTGDVTTGTLYSVIIEATNRAGGDFQWENDVVTVGVSDLSLRIGFPSTNTTAQGEAALDVRDGVVTTATATGMYAGLLPAVGARVPLSFSLPNEVNFDYDLGEFDGHDLDVDLNFDGAGEAQDAKAADDMPSLTIAPIDPSTPGAVTLSWPETDRPVVVEMSRDLVTWREVKAETKFADGRVWAVVPVGTGPMGYFRLRGLELADTTPPTFQAVATCGFPEVTVHYSEPVDPQGAMNPENYSVLSELTGRVKVLNVMPQDAGTFRLFLSQPMQAGAPYLLQVQGVKDLAGNFVPPGAFITFGCLGAGQ